MKYKQCRLECETGATIGWIPSHAARVGYRMRLKELGEMLWTVIQVGDKSRDLRELKEDQNSNKWASLDG